MRYVLHVGTPKTGTTSIQHFLAHNGEWLARHGAFNIDSPRGNGNLKELFHAAADAGRADTFRAPRFKPVSMYVRDEIRKRTAEHYDKDVCILSAEALTYLRHETEIERLRRLFPDGAEFTVIIVLRDRDTFLARLIGQLLKQQVAVGSPHWQFFELGADCWVADYKRLTSLYCGLTDDVQTIDYDAAVDREENIIEPVMAAAGVPLERGMRSHLPMLNRSAA